jgi:hypothetical protein
MLEANVGPVVRRDPVEPLSLAFEPTLTDAADKEAALAMVRAELDGGPATGLEPSDEGGELMVRYRSAVVHATPR